MQVILLGMSVRKYRDESGSIKTLPVCSSYLSDLRDFILNTSPPLVMDRPAEYTSAFNTSFNTFSSDPSYGKGSSNNWAILLFCKVNTNHIQCFLSFWLSVKVLL